MKRKLGTLVSFILMLSLFSFNAFADSSQQLASGDWNIWSGKYGIRYSVAAEYRNREATSVQVRLKWTNSITASTMYGYGQYFTGNIGGKSTGEVTICTASKWMRDYTGQPADSVTVYSSWITVSISASTTSVPISATYRDQNGISGSWSKSLSIPKHNHSYSTSVTKKATCTTKGVKKYTCSCGYSYQEDIAALGHTAKDIPAIPATCTAEGRTAGSYCSVCNTVLKEQSAVAKRSHSWNSGTVYSDVTVYTCTVCNASKVVETPTPVKNSITASNFTKSYSSKAQSFSIGAKVNDGAKLSYKSDNKSVTVDSSGKVTIKKGFIGKATITITASATKKYSSTSQKITVTVTPVKPAISKVSSPKKKWLKVTWKKVKSISGYQIQVSDVSSFNSENTKKFTAKASKTSWTLSGLNSKKKFFVRMRTYKTVSGKPLYSAWSGAKSVKIK